MSARLIVRNKKMTEILRAAKFRVTRNIPKSAGFSGEKNIGIICLDDLEFRSGNYVVPHAYESCHEKIFYNYQPGNNCPESVFVGEKGGIKELIGMIRESIAAEPDSVQLLTFEKKNVCERDPFEDEAVEY